ncbi:UrcA family protein [Maricaulaceae bacterium MS644]
MKRINALILPIAAAAALGASVSAVAQDAPQSAVHYKMSELTTEAGRTAVLQRLEAASRRVCQVPSRTSLEMRRLQRICIADAMADAERTFAQNVAAAERDGRIQLADSRR